MASKIALGSNGQRGISIYIHIPYCFAKCGYCDFFSVTDYESSDKIIKILLEEFLIRYNNIGSPPIQTVFIGGGTPNSIPLKQLFPLLNLIGRNIESEKTEFSIESNPEFISPEFISMINDSAVNRLSIGVQSFREKELKTLQRNTSAKNTIRAAETAVEKFDGILNFDLMCEIPGQSTAGSLEDIRIAADIGADHISRYSLTIEKGTPFYSRYPDLINKSEEDVFFTGITLLQELGYRRYEVSNFAKTGFECRHNLHYWHLDDYIGLGPSGVSTLSGYSGSLDTPVRIENPHSLHAYFELFEDSFKYSSGMIEHLSWNEYLFEHIMMGTRLVEGIAVSDLLRKFPLAQHPTVYKMISCLKPFIKSDSKRIALNDEYFDKQNMVLEKVLDSMDTP